MLKPGAAFFLLAALAFAAPAQAEGNDPAARCRNGDIPFAATDANRLNEAQLRETFTDKKLGYIRASTRTPGRYVNATRELRADGSVAHNCTVGQGLNGPWRPCADIGSDKASIKGSRDVGVWRIANRSLCMASASLGGSEACFAIHRQGTTLAARQLTGSRTHCIEGTVTAQ